MMRVALVKQFLRGCHVRGVRGEDERQPPLLRMVQPPRGLLLLGLQPQPRVTAGDQKRHAFPGIVHPSDHRGTRCARQRPTRHRAPLHMARGALQSHVGDRSGRLQVMEDPQLDRVTVGVRRDLNGEQRSPPDEPSGGILPQESQRVWIGGVAGTYAQQGSSAR